MIKYITKAANNVQTTPIKFVSNTNIDYKKWDACIYHSANSRPYVYSWYLDVVAPEWDALVWGDYEMVMPLPVNQKLHIRYLYQPFFVQQLGVFSIHPLSQKTVNEFLEAIPSNIQYVDSYLNEGNQFVIKNMRVAKRINYLLSLRRPYQDIYKDYNTNTKRNLKKAQQQGLYVHQHIQPEVAVQTFRRNVGARLPQLKDGHYQQLERLMYECIHRGIGEVKGVYDEHNDLCATAFFITTHNRIVNLLPASNANGRQNGAMALLIDDTIRANAESMLVFDFEGSMIDSIARFYKGFGAKPIYYWHVQKNDLPWYIKWWKE